MVDDRLLRDHCFPHVAGVSSLAGRSRDPITTAGTVPHPLPGRDGRHREPGTAERGFRRAT